MRSTTMTQALTTAPVLMRAVCCGCWRARLQAGLLPDRQHSSSRRVQRPVHVGFEVRMHCVGGLGVAAT